MEEVEEEKEENDDDDITPTTLMIRLRRCYVSRRSFLNV